MRQETIRIVSPMIHVRRKIPLPRNNNQLIIIISDNVDL